MTPVAEFEPIDILGSIVSRATLHNMGIVKALGLNVIGTEIMVKVIKANDIIPRIIEVKYKDPEKAVAMPSEISVCPVCGGAVELINDQHFCTNIEECEAQLLGRIVALGGRDALDIVGLSEATAQKMIDYYENLDSYINLDFTLPLHFSLEDIKALPGFASKSAEKLYNEIQKAKSNTPINKCIYACSIPLIGRTASRIIGDNFSSFDSLAYEVIYNECNELRKIDGFGDAMASSLKKHVDLLGELWQAGVRPIEAIKKTVKKVDKQLTFVITGKFQDGERLIKRDEIKARIEESGHKVSGSVTSNTDYLLIDDVDSTTSKAKKARELNVKLIGSLKDLSSIID